MIKLLDLQAVTRMHAQYIKEALNRVVDSGWYLLGEETRQFEADYAKYIGTQHCIAVANGLDALRLILRAYKEMGTISDGDEIIVPANTYIATILAITDNNLKPVLIEPTFENLELDTKRIEERISNRTKAVMTVHLYGRLAYDELLADICKRHNLLLLEDCAQSHGCAWKGRRTGSLGDAAAHSFYPGKNLGALGDAGCVTTDDERLAGLVRTLANYGSHRKYEFSYAGINSRMAETDAAVLDVKLRFLDEDNRHRQQVAEIYYSEIKNPLITLPSRICNENNVYHQFPIFCAERDLLQRYLTENGVQTLIHYPIPPHKQKCYPEWNNLSLPITERIHAQELSIPISPALSFEDAHEVARLINAFSY